MPLNAKKKRRKNSKTTVRMVFCYIWNVTYSYYLDTRWTFDIEIFLKLLIALVFGIVGFEIGEI